MRRRTIIAALLAGCCANAALGIPGSVGLAAFAADPAGEATPTAGRPNILFIMSDDHAPAPHVLERDAILAMMLDAPLTISGRFPRVKAPGTGRAAVQLTSGAATCYSLYYFAPTLSKEGRYVVHHCYEKGEVQL